METNAKIYIAGINGLVGSTIKRTLEAQGYTNIFGHSHTNLDVTDQSNVLEMFAKEKPEYVFLCAAKVGGISANDTYPADFIYNNLCIQNNVIHASHLFGVKKLLFLGSVCIYPKVCQQPIKEEYLLNGHLEPTNKPYAIAKIAGIEMCQAYNKQYGSNFISCMPANLYGPNDNFHPKNSHVIPALIRKFHEAKINGDKVVEVWGDGTPLREFLYVDDMAEACVLLMNEYDGELINIGSGSDISISDLAHLIAEVVGFKGELEFNTGMPNGTLKRLMDSSRINDLGWKAKTPLKEGLERTYKFALNIVF